MEIVDVEIEQKHLTMKIKTLPVKFVVDLNVDLHSYRRQFRKKPKRDSWRIKRLR